MPDAGRDAFYARSSIVIPDNQNIAVAISGINAPIDTDVIEHGRFVINGYEDDLLSSNLKNKIFKETEIKFIGKRDEFECWLYDNITKTKENCASEERIRALLLENKLLIQRYTKLYQILGWQGLTESGGQTLLDINRLLVADIKLDIDAGNAELAYQKWKANTVFINQVLKHETTTIEKAIFLVMDGFILASIEYLLSKQPQIITKHYEELMVLLRPTGLTKYNLQGMLKTDYHFYKNYLFGKVTTEQNLHVNYILNRIYHVHKDFSKEAHKSPFNIQESQRVLRQQYYVGSNQFWNFDFLDPQHSLISNLITNGSLSSFNLVGSMHHKSALIKLLNLKIKIHQQNIVDSDVQAFLNNVGSEYNNPFTNKPMRWDTVKRLLICDKPNSDKSAIEARL